MNCLQNNNLFKPIIASNYTMNKWMELMLGLILVVAAILVWGYSANWELWGISFDFGTAAWQVLKGAIIWVVIMIGLLFLMLGISDLKD